MTPEVARLEGFQPAAIRFMVNLAAHNDRAWFQPDRLAKDFATAVPIFRFLATLRA